MLLILKPQASDFNAYAMLPLASAILYAFAMILTRTKCRDESPLVLSLALNASFVVVGALATAALAISDPPNVSDDSNRFLFSGWIGMEAREWLAMVLLAAIIIIGSVGAAIAYQSGPASIVSTYDFFYLGFAALWGLVFFSEVPDAVTAGGIALVAIAGVIAVRR